MTYLIVTGAVAVGSDVISWGTDHGARWPTHSTRRGQTWPGALRCIQPPRPQAPRPSKAELPLSRYALQRTQTW